MPTKPLHIAIIGSGLAGSALAERLAGHHAVTIFERGPEGPARPPQPAMTSRHFGLYPVLRRTLGYALLPVSPRYLHLFRIQSDMAGAIEASVLKPRWTSKQAKTDTRAPVA